MDAVEALHIEHGLIARATTALEAYTDAAERGDAVDRSDLARFVTFFHEFVDLGHHDKEETILMPSLASCGFDWNDSPLRNVRQEHDQERYLMRGLQQAALQTDEWTEEARRHFISIAREFVRFQRDHIKSEEVDLFPAVRERLDEVAARALARELEEFDAQRHDLDTAMRRLGEELIARYPKQP